MRRAQASDVTRLAAIDAQVSVRPLSEAQYQRFCGNAQSPGNRGLVAELAGQVCALVVYSLVLDEVNIINIAVEPGHQGRGIGRQLLQGALADMRESGARRCLLDVRGSNTPARALYESEGFVLDGTRPAYYTTEQGGREDALLMSKQL